MRSFSAGGEAGIVSTVTRSENWQYSLRLWHRVHLRGNGG